MHFICHLSEFIEFHIGQIFRVDLRQAAWFSALPWAMMAILGYAAGTISDMLIRSGVTVTYTRKVMQVYFFCGIAFHLH